jgi:mono/diheme cytochrome c family protein
VGSASEASFKKEPHPALPEDGEGKCSVQRYVMMESPKLILAALLVTAALPAHADDYDFGRRMFLNKAQCSYCHGWAGDGAGEPQSSGAAANLRITTLKRDQLIEVISCGIPGKAMPHFDEDAYTDKRCYGVTEAELGRDTPALPPGSTLNKREIAAVADYLLAKVVGRGPDITKAECEEAYGEGARMCNRYPAK